MKQKYITFALLLCLPVSAMADDTESEKFDITKHVKATIGATTDYVFRGISQADENPAAQGSVDFEYNGFYSGVWGSNVDFGSVNDANLETDIYTGYKFSYDRLNFNLGGIYYAYPGANSSYKLDYFEYQGSVTADLEYASLTGSVNYSPDFSAGSGDAFYTKALISAPVLKNLNFNPIITEIGKLPVFNTLSNFTKQLITPENEVNLFFSVGRQTVSDNTRFALPDYNDYSVGVTYNLKDFNFQLQYTDTTIDKTACTDICSGRYLLSVSKTF